MSLHPQVYKPNGNPDMVRCCIISSFGRGNAESVVIEADTVKGWMEGCSAKRRKVASADVPLPIPPAQARRRSRRQATRRPDAAPDVGPITNLPGIHHALRTALVPSHPLHLTLAKDRP